MQTNGAEMEGKWSFFSQDKFRKNFLRTEFRGNPTHDLPPLAQVGEQTPHLRPPGQDSERTPHLRPPGQDSAQHYSLSS